MRGGNSDITILPNVNTLQCILNVVGAKLKVSFDVHNSLANVLGFNRQHAGEQLVNIMSVNSILLHCNIMQYYSIFIPVWCTSTGCLQFLPKCCSWTKDTGSTKPLNLSPGNCRRHFNSDSVANGSTWNVLGFTWRGIYVFIFVNANTMYVQYKVIVSEYQVDTLKNAIRLKKGVTLCFPKGGIWGDHVLLLIPAQINRLDRAPAEGRRVQIRMSARQVAKNASYTGGFLCMLASRSPCSIYTVCRTYNGSTLWWY